jgi:hypothetical protein
MLRLVRACASLACVLLLSACAEPPSKEMNQAQGAIDAARAAGADQYASQELAAATDALKRSEDAVAQNDYRLALSLAIDSRERAQSAAKLAADNRVKARGDAERTLAEANSALNQARTQLEDPAMVKLPRRTSAAARTALAAADKQVQEARAALAREDYPRAVAAARAASTRIENVMAPLRKPAAPPAARKHR